MILDEVPFAPSSRPAVSHQHSFLTFRQLVKVHEEAQHEGARDEAEGRTDGGGGEEEA